MFQILLGTPGCLGSFSNVELDSTHTSDEAKTRAAKINEYLKSVALEDKLTAWEQEKLDESDAPAPVSGDEDFSDQDEFEE